ncbi:helix-turn-helix domain-containing protein [Zobellella maritima]|uniref:helix-turn-helix domain-containing protein n=1 Tax=Zobellella maritima TaxID=2059725 RepID=UPI000E3033EF|nr:AraC family transcriptional regulator [Zobellella maritima]
MAVAPELRFSIRSYTLTVSAHHHAYAQLVLPLQGRIDIELAGQRGRVGPSRCVVIPAGELHSFAAEQQARFLVVDLPTLPVAMQRLETPFVALSPGLQRYSEFVETQLQQKSNPDLIRDMGRLFYRLLEEQDWQPRLDPRLQRAVQHLKQDLARTPSLSELAAISFLSVSQYKTLFKQQLGMTTGQYLQQLRMEKARSLLSFTDMPIAIIAERVGFQNASAFSRRFRAHFGLSPRRLR